MKAICKKSDKDPIKCNLSIRSASDGRSGDVHQSDADVRGTDRTSVSCMSAEMPKLSSTAKSSCCWGPHKRRWARGKWRPPLTTILHFTLRLDLPFRSSCNRSDRNVGILLEVHRISGRIPPWILGIPFMFRLERCNYTRVIRMMALRLISSCRLCRHMKSPSVSLRKS